MKRILLIILIACSLHSSAQTSHSSLRESHLSDKDLRWEFAGGGTSWSVNPAQSHTDHIEMSGRRISAIITYGVDSMQQLVWRRKLVFPMLRTLPNNTHASLQDSFDDNIIDSIKADGRLLKEKPVMFSIDGHLQLISSTNADIRVIRSIYPSVDKAVCLEKYILINLGSQQRSLEIPIQEKEKTTDPAKGAYGAYTLRYQSYNGGSISLPPGASYSFYIAISGRRAADDPAYFSADYEWEKRKTFIDEITDRLVLHTPNDTLNRMFAFAKIRAAENVFDTKGGLMHGPGGGSYYAAIWANDEAEYVGPFFPFLGNIEANESAKNCYRLFATYMNPDYNPLPSSIIAEGADVWKGAGDRGDQAMIAYGASRFALAYADEEEAQKLWPLITWCLEYLKRQETPDGVIASASDELEGRFPTGKINLSTNALTYGALVSAARLARSLDHTKEATDFRQRALQLKANINKYFGATVQGFDTYRYYEGNTTLRSWICLPLVMGIFEKKDQTIKALLSKYLWTKNGILTESGSQTFWDRSTLYAFRGLFYAGATDTSLRYFNYYSAMRLLGEHVPYAVEAWPEGDQRHLSAESALYCRTVTEGLFGIEPTGFNSFTIMPRLPKGWDHMSLEHIRAFQKDFSIKVTRAGQKEKVLVTIADGPTKEYVWDGKNPLAVDLIAGPAPAPTPASGQDAGVTFTSSDTALEHAFTWAKTMALHYQAPPGDPVGPWYESALPPRDAFCMRDVSHQCIGAEILGMHPENQNMFAKFTSHISGSKDWCSWWEIDKHDRPSPADYRNDKEFWYNLNANFDLMDASWRTYLWTGDSLFINDPSFKNFYDRTTHEYIRQWILQPDSLLTRPAYPNTPKPFNIEDAFHRCRGLPSYSEGIPDLKMGVDLIGALYRGCSSYASMAAAAGQTTTAAEYRQKALAYRHRIDADWWDEKALLYRTHYTNDHQFGKAEGETFLLWFDALTDTARKRHTIEHLQSMDLNVENLSYLPLQYYKNGYPDQACTLILHLADPTTKRREYPEVSYGMVEAVVQGLMGVDVDARTRTVSTTFRGKGTATLADLPVLNTFITLTHDGPGRSSITNTGKNAFKWKALFTNDQGRIVSHKEITIAPGRKIDLSL